MAGVISEPKIETSFLAAQAQQSHQDETRTVISKPASTLAPTTASTVIPARLESAEREEEQSDDNRSHTSYATSVDERNGDDRLSVVPLEDVSPNGAPFECPYCWTIQIITNQRAWW
jgi:hypothetical protein